MTPITVGLADDERARLQTLADEAGRAVGECSHVHLRRSLAATMPDCHSAAEYVAN